MKKFIIKNRIIIIDYCLLLLALVFSLFEFKNIAIFLLIIASGVLVKIIKDIVGNYMSFAVLFSCFHVLYGLAGVVSKCWFNQISATYGKIFVYSPYLIAYSLCTIALLSGIIIANKKYEKKEANTTSLKNNNINKYFLFVACCGFAITSICEMINFIRVGGFTTLFAGKATYQAAVDELRFTLPTQYIFQVSLATLGVFVLISIAKNEKIQIKKIILCICLVLPYILAVLLLGRRGPLLAILLILLVSFFQVKPLKKMPIKLIVILLVTYLVLGIIYIVRNDIGLLFTDLDKFIEKFNINSVIRHLNPAVTEFGCTYGNFNKFYIENDHEYLYGESYIQGLTHVIPSYLYPGEKPRMITYEFRDKYFPSKAEISSVASTGFSSILETYWNFWYFGAIMYIGYGYVLIWLEKKLKRISYFGMLEYISIITIVYYFHRSEFAYIASNIILTTAMVLIIYMFYNLIYKGKHRKFNKTKKRE